MTFGLPFLADGIDFAVLAMGIFGIAEILRNLDHTEHRDGAPGHRPPAAGKEDFKQSYCRCCAAPSSARSSASCPATARCSGRSPPIRSRRSSPRIRAAWPRRHRGRGRSGSGQQRRRADLVHPAPDARHSAQCRDGADGRRHDHPRHHPRTAGDDQEPDPVLGHDRLDVVGNLMLLDHQPAGRHVGAAAQGAVSPDVPGDPDVLLHRHLLDQLARPT